MGKLKHNFKKGMALVLSLAMVAGLALAMSGGANTVQAAAGTGTKPSVTAYATKNQLMDDTFKPKDDGTADNYGKLVFGKNSSGSAQEWYILGKDEGVSEDNTIIFAASPIAKDQKFNSSTSEKTYDSTTVYANHYGAGSYECHHSDNERHEEQCRLYNHRQALCTGGRWLWFFL